MSQKPNPDLCATVSHSDKGMGASSAKDARAVRSGAALRDALLRLLARKAFDQITVREICAEAGVHYATFFRHHPGKEALLDHIATEQISTLVDLTMTFHDTSGSDSSVRVLCAYVDEHRALWSTLLNGGAGAAMREEWLRRARIVAAAHEPDSTWLPTELGTICSVALIVETVAWWLEQPAGDYPVDRIAAIMHRLIRSFTHAPD